MAAIHQIGLNAKKPKAIGIDKANAVTADSCWGEKFFPEGMLL